MSHTLIILSALCFTMALSGGSGMVGGWQPMAANDESVQTNSHFAAQRINQQANSLQHKKLVDVHSAEVQVVAGIKYKLVFYIGTTTLRRGDNSDEEVANAALNKEMPIEKCTAVVWERSWLNERELLEFHCERHMSHDEFFSAENQAREEEAKKAAQTNRV